jgi:hypothetical protein
LQPQYAVAQSEEELAAAAAATQQQQQPVGNQFDQTHLAEANKPNMSDLTQQPTYAMPQGYSDPQQQYAMNMANGQIPFAM